MDNLIQRLKQLDGLTPDEIVKGLHPVRAIKCKTGDPLPEELRGRLVLIRFDYMAARIRRDYELEEAEHYYWAAPGRGYTDLAHAYHWDAETAWRYAGSANTGDSRVNYHLVPVE